MPTKKRTITKQSVQGYLRKELGKKTGDELLNKILKMVKAGEPEKAIRKETQVFLSAHMKRVTAGIAVKGGNRGIMTPHSILVPIRNK